MSKLCIYLLLRCLTPSDSSQDVFLEFQALAASHGAIQVRWVPGHTDIPGNDQADKLAKAGSSAPEPEGAQPTLAYLRRIARQKPKEAFETWWSTSAPEQYKRLNLKATTCCPPELTLPRAALHHLLAARSLHGDFAAYHERFNHSDAHLVCSCNRRKAPDHIFYCRKVPPRHRKRLAPLPNAAVTLAIGKDFTKFAELSKASAFFQKISLMFTCTIRGFLMGSQSQYKELVQYIDEKKLKPAFDDTVFELADAKDAYRKLKEQKHFAKVVIRMDHDEI
ncbi:hypothetical protein FOFC_08883 [Fusarium oxysporum]|nr:hypothetical protein FOFC_08883 [Fusarium oxysporum]